MDCFDEIIVLLFIIVLWIIYKLPPITSWALRCAAFSVGTSNCLLGAIDVLMIRFLIKICTFATISEQGIKTLIRLYFTYL